LLEKHIDIQALEEKIELLFDYRLFPQLFLLTGEGESVMDSFNQKLTNLQKSIYFLDAHLEANWQIDDDKLAYHWHGISNSFLPFGIADFNPYVSHIRRYQMHELDLRAGKSPLRFEMEYFYFYKSCDVKLLRRLIYEYFGLAKYLGSLSAWRYYDLITEVNDDVEDLYEDIDFYNGNSFLLSMLTHGKEKTMQKFTRFIDDIALKSAHQKIKKNTQVDIQLLTIQRIEETRELLYERITNLNLSEIVRSKMNQVLV